MRTVTERGREFVDRLKVQREFPDAFVRCPWCSSGPCPHCVGTRKVSRAARREMEREAA